MRPTVGKAAIILTVAVMFVFVASTASTRDKAEENKEQPERMIKAYASLPSLIHMVCEDASSQFYNFFSPSEVNVKPFVVVDEFSASRISMLGMTMADQMSARVNNDSLEPGEERGEFDQWMDGIIQELDGYMRVHISGMNSRGERRSYVVAVEMSGPLYRALHAGVGE